MKFMVDNNPHGKFFETNADVTILDVKPPKIFVEPVSDQDNCIQMKCTASISSGLPASFGWRCGKSDVIPFEILRNETTIVSKVEICVDKEKRCTCSVIWSDRKFNVSSSIDLHRKRPIIQQSEPMSCMSGGNITLQCSVDQMFNLASGYWLHSFDTSIIKTIAGVRENNSLFLQIQSCQMTDMGNYTCFLKSNEILSNKLFTVNSSVTLGITGPPKIITTKVNRTISKTILSVTLYLYESLYSFKWLSQNMYLANTTESLQMCSTENTDITLDGINKALNGILCSMTVNSMPSDAVTSYTFCVENSKGETCHSFDVQQDFANWSFLKRDITTVTIVFTLVTALLILSSGLISHKLSDTSKESIKVSHTDISTQQFVRQSTAHTNNATGSINSQVENMYLTPEAEPDYDEIIEIDCNGYLDPIVNHYDEVEENTF